MRVRFARHAIGRVGVFLDHVDRTSQFLDRGGDFLYARTLGLRSLRQVLSTFRDDAGTFRELIGTFRDLQDHGPQVGDGAVQCVTEGRELTGNAGRVFVACTFGVLLGQIPLGDAFEDL